MRFYVDKGNTRPYYAGKSTYIYPCFILIADNWDDYGVKTLFSLYYFKSKKSYKSIGLVKILCKQLSNIEGG